MKKLLILAAVTAMGLTASAQFVGEGSSNTSSDDISKGWNTFYVQYNNVGIAGDLGKLATESANGVSIGFNHAFKVAPTLPLYVETGIGAQFIYKSYSDDSDIDYYEGFKYGYEYSQSGYMLSAKVPVNVLYRFVIPNTELAIEPLLGLDLRVNVLGKEKEKETRYRIDYNSYSETPIQKEETRDEITRNLFDKKDMDGDPIKRFQIGWHVGANLTYKNIMFGFQYGQDFMKIADYEGLNPRLRTTTVSLGYRF